MGWGLMGCEEFDEGLYHRIETIEKKLDELIHHVNWIARYYECKDDYAGNIIDLKGECI